MKKIIILLFCVALYSCQQKKRDWNHYLENPDKKDTLCILDINRAKNDISNGEIVFTESFGFGSSSLRYESELKKLCIEHGLVFKYEAISCVIFKGQTQGCYESYMDKVLFEKFGLNFKEKLHRKADSLLVVNAKEKGKIITSWDCDEESKLLHKNRSSSNYISIKTKNLDLKKDKSNYGGGYPFFDLSFIIEKDSTINSFQLSNYVARNKTNENFKSKLFEITINHLKKEYPIWIPGKIKDIPVRTKHHVRVFFNKEL